MRCLLDIRKRVVAFVEGGGSKAEAARRFQVGEARVYRWVKPSGLDYKRPGPRTGHKLDHEALGRHVDEHADMRQKERAHHFGVSRHCIWSALRKRGISRKKMMGYKERSLMKRRRFLRLRERYARRNKKFIYIDESGFEPSAAAMLRSGGVHMG